MKALAEWPITEEVKKACAELVREAREKQEYRPTVMALILNHADEILLVQSAKNPDDWGLPQGGIEEGEGAGHALFREVREEVGIESAMINSGHYLGTHDLDDEPGRGDFNKGKRYLTFLLRYFGSRKLSVKADEIRIYTWVSRSDLPMALATTRGARRYVIMQFVEDALADISD